MILMLIPYFSLIFGISTKVIVNMTASETNALPTSSTPTSNNDEAHYDRLKDQLTKNVKTGDGKIDSFRLLQNLSALTRPNISDSDLSFLWLYASQYSRANIRKGQDYGFHLSLFNQFWKRHKLTITDYLKEASLSFLSQNSKYLSDSMFHTNLITNIIKERLYFFEQNSTGEDTNSILRVYRGLRLSPPAQLTSQLNQGPIKNLQELQDFTGTLHSITRAGTSIVHNGFNHAIAFLPLHYVSGLNKEQKNSLLWSLTTQFAMAQDSDISLDPKLNKRFQSFHSNIKCEAQFDSYLRRTWNMAAIILDRDLLPSNFDDPDRISEKEYEFMHDFREYALTPTERANLKNAGIDKFSDHLGRDVDGHYRLGDKPVIIEFDGRSHYRTSKDGVDEPNGSTKLQTHILRKLYPDRVIVRLHYRFGNSLSSLPDEQKPDAFAKLREMISTLEPNAYYMDLHQNKWRIQTSKDVQMRHNKELSADHL